MVKHNNVIPNQHFKKDWQQRVRVKLNQATRKKARRVKRQAKAEAIAPRPLQGLLRPAVHCQTQRYNTKVREGRGFTLEELKEAGINAKQARSIGIAVDHRRKNKSVESLQLNVQRLQAYKAKLVVFPLKSGKVKQGDSGKELTADATQHKGTIVEIVQPKAAVEYVEITDAMKAGTAVGTMKQLRATQYIEGKRRGPKRGD